MLLVAAVAALIGIVQMEPRALRHGPGVQAPYTPNQVDLSRPQRFQFEGYSIEKLARFNIEARVLSKQRYWFGREADLSPVDFALGWGPMSDETVLDEISISQGGRFYHWQTSSSRVGPQDIIRNSANMHLIPADDAVERALKSDVRTGDIIQLTGYLVAVTGEDGWRWRSSMTRADTGNHACELIWVERVGVRN